MKSITLSKPCICEAGLNDYKTFNFSIREIAPDAEGNKQWGCLSFSLKNPSIANVVSVVLQNGILLSEEEIAVVKENTLASPQEALVAPLIDVITAYDSSPAVNSFVYNGMDLWLDKATRVGLMNSTTILKSAGQETTTLWFGDINITLPVDNVIQMLSALEIYALDCYNVTARHISEASNLDTIEAVLSYDYTTGYPQKLVFG